MISICTGSHHIHGEEVRVIEVWLKRMEDAPESPAELLLSIPIEDDEKIIIELDKKET